MIRNLQTNIGCCLFLLNVLTPGCKGNEAGMQQLSETIDTLNVGDRLTISIGDSLYGSQKCRESAVSISNHIHLFRLNSTRNIYNGVEESLSPKRKSKGRPKHYGNKINLKNYAISLNLMYQQQRYIQVPKANNIRLRF